jgi:hypothetical protein
MKQTRIFVAAAVLGLLAMLTVSRGKGGGISSLDVVGRESINSFQAVLSNAPKFSKNFKIQLHITANTPIGLKPGI